ncbi:hypothetical protein CYY_002706 [Polysphondylium violaceum]|uniref:Cyclin n=1 Tax=Polysphondylium violaceum TaxID=133409 RepID=A0A8J4Q192_9MYCE|nr:hypothetical protein CYY_002706 [Polysphondylium violaceum]
MASNLESIFEILQNDLPKYNPIIPKRDTKDNILLDVLCTVINKLITNGDKIKNDRREFYPPNRKPPTIGIDAYLARLLKYSPCSKECFVMSLVYIDRFLRQCDLIVNSMNIHRLVITSLLISTKYLDDIFYNNEFYSQVGGISLREMNSLEVCFLSMMDYTVNCSLDEFEKYSREVEKAKRKVELEQNNAAATITVTPAVPSSSQPSNTPSNINPLVYNFSNNSNGNSNNNSNSSNNSPLKTIPIPTTRRRGSCDQSTSMQNKAPTTGWVA